MCLLAVSVSLPMHANGDDKDFVIITQENGKTLGYSPASGVQILTVDGLKFKDLNRNGKLDKYEDWRLPAKERAQDLASQLSIEEIAGLMLYSAHQAIPGASAGFGAAETFHVSAAPKAFFIFVVKKLNSPHRHPNHCLQPLRLTPPHITQINLMMAPALREIRSQSILFHKPPHYLKRRRLLIIRTNMQALNTKPFLPGQKFCLRKILLLFPRCFPARPSKVCLCHSRPFL